MPRSVSGPLGLPCLGQLQQATPGRGAWSGGRRCRRPGPGRRLRRSCPRAAPPRTGAARAGRRRGAVCGSPASGPPSRRGPRSPPPRPGRRRPPPRSRPAREAPPRRRRSRTRRSRARAPPRPRWGRGRSARRGRSRPAPGVQRTARRINRTPGARGRRSPRRPARERRLRGSRVASSFSASSRCSSERSLGTITWMTMRRSPGGPPFEPGRPWPRRANWVPCWIPEGSSTSRSPSWLGILTLVPEHGLNGRDLDRVHEVLAAHRPAPHLEAEGAAEDRPEDVLDRAEAGAAAGGKPPERRPSWPKRS